MSNRLLTAALGALLGLAAACATDPIQTVPGDDDDSGGDDDDSGGDDDAPDASPPNDRVTEGLVALYEFNGVTGATVVADTSGVGAPLDLTIGDPAQVAWGDGGLTINGPAAILSAGPATKIFDACTASNEITLEAWVQPSTVATNGRMLSSSSDGATRNYQVKQQDTTYVGRVRTTDNLAGNAPETESALGSATIDAVQHVVTTRLSGGVEDSCDQQREVGAGQQPGRLRDLGPGLHAGARVRRGPVEPVDRHDPHDRHLLSRAGPGRGPPEPARRVLSASSGSPGAKWG